MIGGLIRATVPEGQDSNKHYLRQWITPTSQAGTAKPIFPPDTGRSLSAIRSRAREVFHAADGVTVMDASRRPRLRRNTSHPSVCERRAKATTSGSETVTSGRVVPDSSRVDAGVGLSAAWTLIGHWTVVANIDTGLFVSRLGDNAIGRVTPGLSVRYGHF